MVLGMEEARAGLIFMGTGSLEYTARRCGGLEADSVSHDGVLGGYVARKTKLR